MLRDLYYVPYLLVESQYLGALGAQANIQNPWTPPSGRKITTGDFALTSLIFLVKNIQVSKKFFPMQ